MFSLGLGFTRFWQSGACLSSSSSHCSSSWSKLLSSSPVCPWPLVLPTSSSLQQRFGATDLRWFHLFYFVRVCWLLHVTILIHFDSNFVFLTWSSEVFLKERKREVLTLETEEDGWACARRPGRAGKTVRMLASVARYFVLNFVWWWVKLKTLCNMFFSSAFTLLCLTVAYDECLWGFSGCLKHAMVETFLLFWLAWWCNAWMLPSLYAFPLLLSYASVCFSNGLWCYYEALVLDIGFMV